MQNESTRRSDREADMTANGVDSARAVGNSIRQAFLTHMGEQQRQYPTSLSTSARRPAGGDTRKR
jgi:hypothetical protein